MAINDQWVEFLQWALPRMGFRWRGFRKVRRQVCRRIRRRLDHLELGDLQEYRDHLHHHPEEWLVLDGFCRITISRFFRDRGLFRFLGSEVMPRLAHMVAEAAQPSVRAMSLGCASGEEVYSLNMAWQAAVGRVFPGVRLELAGVDADEGMLVRARRALYPPGSLREVPEELVGITFERSDGDYRLRPEFVPQVRWLCLDIRHGLPTGPWHLVLCRNLAFTYFDDSAQHELMSRLSEVAAPGGFLVLGSHERIPRDSSDFIPAHRHLPVWKLGRLQES